MQVIEDLIYRLVADASPLEGSLKKAEDQVKKSTENITSTRSKGAKKAEQSEAEIREHAIEDFKKAWQKAIDQNNDFTFKERVKLTKRIARLESDSLRNSISEELKARKKAASDAEKTRNETIKKNVKEWQKTIDRQNAAIKEAEEIQKSIEKRRAAEQKKEADTANWWVKQIRLREIREERAAKKRAENEKRDLDRLAEQKKKALERHQRAEEAARQQRIRKEMQADERIMANRKRLLSMVNSVLIGIGVPRFYKSIVKEASNALEANNKLRAVFSLMTDEAKAAAKELTDFYGVSTVNARSMLADTGNILTNFGIQQDIALQMSAQINKLGVDLASFVNYQGGAAGAANALTKALLGEREAAKALGVAITENDIKNLAKSYGLATTGLTRQQRALLTLEVMLKQTKNAQGDFERSSKDLENQVRILKGAFDDLKLVLGEEVIPFVIKAVGSLTDLTTVIKDADPAVHALIIGLPSLALAIKGVALAYKFFSTVVAASALNPMLLAMVGISAALSAALIAFEDAKQESQDFSGAVNDLTHSMIEGNNLLERRNKLLKENASDTKNTTDMLLEQVDAQLLLNEAETVRMMDATGARYKENLNTIDKLHKSYTELGYQVKAYAKAINGTLDAEIAEYKSKENMTRTEKEYYSVLLDAQMVQNTSYEATVRNFDDFSARYDDVSSEFQQATKENSDSVLKLAMQFKDNEEVLDSYTDKLGVDLVKAVHDAIANYKELVTTTYDIGEAIAASEYKTQDWESLLNKANKAILKADEAASSDAGDFTKIAKDKIAALEEEKKTYLGYIDAREAGLIMEHNGNKEEARLSIEWEGLQDDRAKATEYYQKAEIAVWKECNNDRKKAYDDYLDDYREFSKKLAVTRDEKLTADKADVKHQYDELYKNYKASSDVTPFAGMENLVEDAANGLDVSNAYDYLSDKQKAFLDGAIALRKAYLVKLKQLDDDYERDKRKSESEMDIADLGISTGNEAKDYENKRKALEIQREIELDDVAKTEAEKERIKSNYDLQIAELDRQEQKRKLEVQRSDDQALLQSEVDADKARFDQLKKEQDKEVDEMRKAGKSKEEVNEKIAEYESRRLDILSNINKEKLRLLELQKAAELEEARTTGADTDKIEERYQNEIDAINSEYAEGQLDIAKEHEDGVKAIEAIEIAWEKKYLNLTNVTFARRRELLDAEKDIEIQKAKDKGASIENIEKYYAKKSEDLEKEILLEKNKFASKRMAARGLDPNTIVGMWSEGGGWDQRKAQREAERDEELAKLDKSSAEYAEKSKEWGEIIGKNFADAILDSTKVGIGYLSDITSALESIMTKISDNQIQASENRLKELEDQREKSLKEAESSEKKLTRSQKDEIKRRDAMYEEEIERQKAIIKQQKEEAFKTKKDFAIAEATITGIQATIDAYQSGAEVHWALGAVAAATAASFVGAQIAAIASQPMPSYDVGAWEIEHDHKAMVHAGEAILPKPFAESFRENGGNLGGQGVVVNVYGATDDVSVEEGQSEDGKMKQIDVYMSSKVKQMVMTGQLDAPLQARYDLSRRGRRG